MLRGNLFEISGAAAPSMNAVGEFAGERVKIAYPFVSAHFCPQLDEHASTRVAPSWSYDQ